LDPNYVLARPLDRGTQVLLGREKAKVRMFFGQDKSPGPERSGGHGSAKAKHQNAKLQGKTQKEVQALNSGERETMFAFLFVILAFDFWVLSR